LLCNNTNFKDYVLQDGDMDSLVWNHIFPYNYIPEPQEEAKSYITMQFQYKKVKNANIFKTGRITFYIVCHQSLVKTDYSSLRYDYVLSCIDEVINDTRGIAWLGKMEFDDMSDISLSGSKYVGIAVTYKNVEFL